jgi:hypothetical protein
MAIERVEQAKPTEATPGQELETVVGEVSNYLYGAEGQYHKLTGILGREIKRRGLARAPYTEASPGSGRTITRQGVPLKITHYDLMKGRAVRTVDLLIGEDGRVSTHSPHLGYPYRRAFMPLGFYLEHAPEILEHFDSLARNQEDLGADAPKAAIHLQFYKDIFDLLA